MKRIKGLTIRNYEIYRLAQEGLVSKDIAARLNMSLSTVKYHLTCCYTGGHARRSPLDRVRDLENELVLVAGYLNRRIDKLAKSMVQSKTRRHHR